MTDWDQLREVGDQVSPPAFDSLVSTAGKRARRQRIVTVAATFSVLSAVGLGLLLANDDRDNAVRPVDKVPSGGPTAVESSSPGGVLPLPQTPDGQEPAPLDAGRYQVPLGGTLAFEVDLPEGTIPNSEGLYLQSSPNILKVELAGKDFGVPSDPCHGQYIEPAGRTVGDLVTAIRRQPIYEVSGLEPVTIGAAHGTHLQIAIPSDYDASTCVGAEVGLPGNPDTSNNMPAGYVGDWWILDVHGHRVVAQEICDRCTAEQRSSVADQVRSVTFRRTP